MRVNSFGSRVLGALATINSRLTSIEGRVNSLEERVDARLRETRPVWEAVLRRLEVIDSKLNVFAQDMMDVRAEVELLKKRNPPAA
jgi:uncharacterized protein YaaR (DUF327 family)